MLILKLLQNLIKALNSDGTPGQVAAGIALGSIFGLTPLASLHNLAMAICVVLLNVSLAGVMIGWLVFVPVGFLLDPVFNAIGELLLLRTPALTPMWTALSDTPVVPLTNYNNTVVLGSVITWTVAAVPLYFVARWSVGRYRATIYARLRRSKVVRSLQATKIYTLYQTLWPS